MTSIWNSFESNSNNPANFNLDRQLSKLNLSSELISTNSSETSTLITPTTSSGNLVGEMSENQKESKISTAGSCSTINNNDTLAMMSLIPNLWADKASNDKSKESSTTPISSTTLTPSTSIVSSTAMETSANNMSQFQPIQKQQQQQPNQQPPQPQSNGTVWSASTSPVAQVASTTLPSINGTPMSLNQYQLLPHELMMSHSSPAVSQQSQVQQMEQQHQHQQQQQLNGFYSSPYSQQLPQNTSQSFFSSHSVPMMMSVQQQLSQMSNGAQLPFPLTEENLSLLGRSASTRSTSPQATQMFNPSNNLYQMQTQGLGQQQHHQQPLQYDSQSQPQFKRSQSPSAAFKQQAQFNQQAAANAAAATAQSKSGKNNIDKELYKSEMCAQFQTKGSCPYGSKCQFAHGEFELKQVKRAINWKTKPCTNWAKTGDCRYGKRCCFKHGNEDNGA